MYVCNVCISNDVLDTTTFSGDGPCHYFENSVCSISIIRLLLASSMLLISRKPFLVKVNSGLAKTLLSKYYVSNRGRSFMAHWEDESHS